MFKTKMWMAGLAALTFFVEPSPNSALVETVFRECPHYWEREVGRRPTDGTSSSGTYSSMLLPGTDGDALFSSFNPNVPEYHDCQHFVTQGPGGRRYLDRFAIFASHELDSLDVGLDTVSVTQTCPGDVARCPNAGVLTEARPAAYILAGEAYPPLRIQNRGAYCVLLYMESGSWKARMLFLGSVLHMRDMDCTKDVNHQGVGDELLVYSRDPMLDSAHYPAVARWDYDLVNEQHYIVIRCGDKVCEVGNPDGFAPSPLPATATDEVRWAEGTTTRHLRSVRVKLWYDEQFLAVAYDSTIGRQTVKMLLPSGIIGRVFPRGDLEDSQPGAFDGTWIDVARVNLVLPTEPTQIDQIAQQVYRDKYNFRAPDPEDGTLFNRIALCRGGLGSDCDTPDNVSVTRTCSNHGYGLDTLEWWAKIRSTNGNVVFRCINHYSVWEYDSNGNIRILNNQPVPVKIPTTVRWRWTPLDEGDWIPCDYGCCELIGDGVL